MRLLSLLLLGLGTLLPGLHAAQRTKVDLVNLTPEIKPGAKALIAARFRCDDHFHIYWKNPGDVGMPTKVTLDLPKGLTAGEVAWPVPARAEHDGSVSYDLAGEDVDGAQLGDVRSRRR